MLRGDLTGWTSQMGTLKVDKRKGYDGIEREIKTMYFTVATDRGYRNEIVNGQVVKTKQTDFIFCRANGTAAQILNDYCNKKHEGTGKLVSRKLSVWGHTETYTTNKKVMLEKIIPVPQPDGTTKYFKYQFEGVCPVKEFIFVVSAIEIHDPQSKEPAGMVTSEVPDFVMTEVSAPEGFVDTGVEFQPGNSPVSNPGTNAGNPVPPAPSPQVQPQNTKTNAEVPKNPVASSGLSLDDLQSIDDLEAQTGGLSMPF